MIKLKQESPDEIHHDKLDITWSDGYAIAFGFNRNITKCFLTSETHADIHGYDRNALTYPGRLWSDLNVISFWLYPSTHQMMKKIINLLEKTLNTYKNNHAGNDHHDTENIIDMIFDFGPFDIWNNFKLDVPVNQSGDEDNKHSWGSDVKLIKFDSYKGGELEFDPVDHVKSPMLKGKQDVPKNMGGNKRPAGLTQTQMHQKTTTSDGVIKLKDLLFEDRIASILKKINIIVDVDRTNHAQNQQGRHINRDITDKEIKELVELALPEIARNMIFDKIDMNKTYILVKGLNSKLNIVGIMNESKRKGVIDFVVVTVMRKENFKEKHGTIVVTVRD